MDRPGLYKSVVEDLAHKILGGVLQPGDKLPTEHQMCDQYGVSRTVIRDAMRILRSKGLITARPRSGTVVRDAEIWNLLDHDLVSWARQAGGRGGYFQAFLEARAAIEPQIAAIAAQKATAEDIAAIEAAYVDMRDAFEATPPDLKLYNDADVAYHDALVAATHNAVLRQFGNLIKASLQASFELALDVQEISAESMRAHGDLLDAIRRGDAVAARRYLEIMAGILQERVERNEAFLTETADRFAP